MHPLFSTTRAARTGEFVAAHDALEHEFTVASAVIKAHGDADKTQEGAAKAMGTTQAVVARLESGETMPSTSALSASPRRPVRACGFGLSRRSRATPRRKPADHHMKTSRSRSRRRRKVENTIQSGVLRVPRPVLHLSHATRNSYFSMANFCCENLEFRNSDGSFLPGTGTLIFLRTFNAEAFAQSQHVLKVFLAKLIAGVKLHQLVG